MTNISVLDRYHGSPEFPLMKRMAFWILREYPRVTEAELIEWVLNEYPSATATR